MLVYSSIRVLINIVNHVEQLASVNQYVYWCELTLTKLPDRVMKNDIKQYGVMNDMEAKGTIINEKDN